MMHLPRALAYALFVSTAGAYSTSSRRAFLSQTVSAAVVGSTICTAPVAANAINACPKGSKNCIRTTWAAPSGTSTADMAKAITATLEAYPSSGQADVDLGGYSIVSNDLAGSGTAKVEYYSGVGNFAKFFNGGKTFVDDLEIELDGSVAQVRSASRIGDSDLGVNQKRLLYLGESLKSQGWTIPEPTY